MILCHFDELKLRMFVLFHMEPCVDFNVKYNVKVVKLKKIQAELVSLHKHSEINKHLLCCDHVSLGLGVTILKRVYHVFTYSSHNSKIDVLWHNLQRNKALNRDPYIKTNKKTHVKKTIQLDTLNESFSVWCLVVKNSPFIHIWDISRFYIEFLAVHNFGELYVFNEENRYDSLTSNTSDWWPTGITFLANFAKNECCTTLTDEW